LDYMLIPLVSIIYAALTAHRLLPAVAYEAWAVTFAIVLTLINIPGIRVTARASEAMLGVMGVCAVAFLVLAARYVVAAHGLGGLFDVAAVFHRDTFGLSPVMLGAGVAAMSYIGFDAISTLAEDTVEPERNVGSATLIVCLLQTAICFFTVYLAALVWPDYRSFPEPDTAILDIGRRLGGVWMFGFLTFILLVAGLASALTGQAGASRLLYGMGRDGVISRRIFAHLDPRFSTPTRSIYLMGAFTLVSSVFLRFEIAVELLNFGAFAGFILVNLSVIRHFYFRCRQREGLDLFKNLFFPACGAGFCAYLWFSLSGKAKISGFVWLAIGVVYLAILTRGFRVMPQPLGSLQEAPGAE